MIVLESSCYVALLRNDTTSLRRGIQSVDDLLKGKWVYTNLTDKERSFAINCRAQCYHFLGDLDAAERGYNESIRLDPDEPRWYINRGDSGDRWGDLT